MNLPNKLTITRIILIPVFVAVYFITAIPYRFILSAIVFAIAALTDLLDGKIARKYNLVTDFGKFLDPIADKILVLTALVIMLVDSGNVQILPWYCGIGVAIILARELTVSGFRMLAASKGKVLAADWSGKIKATVQDIAVVVLLVSQDFSLNGILYYLGLALFGIAVILTVYSGLDYLIKNHKVIESK